MTDLERYILDEWTDDYRSGCLVRREFLRRIAVLSGSAAAGLAVLASRGVRASVDEIAQATGGPVAAVAQASGTTVAPNDPAIEARAVSFPLGGTTILAYLALPRNKPNAPGVSVVHENRGLLEHHKDVTRRLAKAGYAALAVDLVSPGGGTNVTDDSAQVTALLVRTPPDDLVGMLQAGVRYLQGLPSVRADRQGAVGFCFGGGMVWRLAPIEDVPKIRAAVLALYGSLDTFVNPGIAAIRQALDQAKVTYEMHIYDGAEHAFFNDTGSRYKPDAARDAWSRTLAWFARWLS